MHSFILLLTLNTDDSKNLFYDDGEMLRKMFHQEIQHTQG